VTARPGADTAATDGDYGPPPKLVAVDLDGTLLRSDGEVSPRTVRTLARVEEQGALLVIVTGRPPRWLHEIAAELGHRGLAVCANGALVYDLHSEQIVERRLIDQGALRTVVDGLRAALPGVAFAAEYGDDRRYEEAYQPFWPDPDRSGQSTLDKVIGEMG
jgi:hydroxymethylpyrimidine pyrophosphatase-like HAD family hydrolase